MATEFSGFGDWMNLQGFLQRSFLGQGHHKLRDWLLSFSDNIYSMMSSSEWGEVGMHKI